MTHGGKLKQATVEATITRADGTVEIVGVIAYYHINPLRRLWWSLRLWLAGRRK